MGSLSPHDPFLTLVPEAIGRLRSLYIYATPKYLQDITGHLSRPTPLLERLSVDTEHESKPVDRPILAPALFDGDLSSLRRLRLQSVRMELPWRNMVNLTSLALGCIEVSVRHLLDFFEGAPHLRVIELRSVIPTSDAQNGRLVSLTTLNKMGIYGSGPPSLLLDHLLIPAGAKLATMSSLRDLPAEANLPNFLDNLKNLPNFTKVNLRADDFGSQLQFTGPNGEVSFGSVVPVTNVTCIVLESLIKFDTSNTKRLDIFRTNPPSRYLPYRALLPMKNLHIFTLAQCKNPDAFIHALDPGLNSSNVVVCPKLEELALTLFPGWNVDTKNMIAVIAARALRGAKLRTLRITCKREELDPGALLEFRKHVSHVEYSPEISVVENGWK